MRIRNPSWLKEISVFTFLSPKRTPQKAFENSIWILPEADLSAHIYAQKLLKDQNKKGLKEKKYCRTFFLSPQISRFVFGLAILFLLFVFPREKFDVCDFFFIFCFMDVRLKSFQRFFLSLLLKKSRKRHTPRHGRILLLFHITTHWRFRGLWFCRRMLWRQFHTFSQATSLSCLQIWRTLARL